MTGNAVTPSPKGEATPLPEVDPQKRPTPLREVAQDTAVAVGLGGTIITALVGYGILSGETGSAATGLLALLPAIVTAASTMIAAHRTARVGELLVTPNSSPVGPSGARLVPETRADKRST